MLPVQAQDRWCLVGNTKPVILKRRRLHCLSRFRESMALAGDNKKNFVFYRLVSWVILPIQTQRERDWVWLVIIIIKKKKPL